MMVFSTSLKEVRLIAAIFVLFLEQSCPIADLELADLSV